MDHIAIVKMMVVVPCVSEINAGVPGGRCGSGQTRGRYETFPGSIITEWWSLLIICKRRKRRFEIGDTGCRESRIIQNVMGDETDFSIFRHPFACVILASGSRCLSNVV